MAGTRGTDDEPPLRDPVAWRKRRSFGVWSAALGVGLLALGIALGVLTITQERSEDRVLFAIAAGGGFVVYGLVALGVSFPPRPLAPALVNAVAVVPAAGTSPGSLPDDWVHLFRRRRMGRAFGLGLGAGALYLLAIVGGTVWLVAKGEEDSGLLLLLGIPALGAIVFAVWAVREAISRRRLSTFGRPPTGLTLGRAGITLLDPHLTRFIPWDEVAGVSAANARTRGGESALYPIIVLRLRPAFADAHPATSAGRGEEVTLQLTLYRAAPRVLFTALATALDDEAFRGGLGTSRTQATLERWTELATDPGDAR